MFIASFDAKCSMFRKTCAGQSVAGHLIADSSRTTLVPQTGQLSGMLKGVVGVSQRIISGIISPAFLTVMRELTFTPRLFIIS
jgi:hypothetical protein